MAVAFVLMSRVTYNSGDMAKIASKFNPVNPIASGPTGSSPVARAAGIEIRRDCQASDPPL